MSDGTYYIGSFNYGSYFGQGTLYNSDGSVIR